MIFGNKLTNLLDICCEDPEYIKVTVKTIRILKEPKNVSYSTKNWDE